MLNNTNRNATLIKKEVYLSKGHDYLETLKYTDIPLRRTVPDLLYIIREAARYG